MNTMYFSGADVIISIKDIALTDVSYIQIVPQQPVLPVYNVYSDVPSVVLRGKFSVRGTLAFNLAYSQPFEHLVRYFEDRLRQNTQQSGRGGFTTAPIKKFGENVYYIQELHITLRNEQPTGHVPKIVLRDVYLTGGTVNAIQDGNPLQDVYSFTALRMERIDAIQQYGV